MASASRTQAVEMVQESDKESRNEMVSLAAYSGAAAVLLAQPAGRDLIGTIIRASVTCAVQTSQLIGGLCSTAVSTVAPVLTTVLTTSVTLPQIGGYSALIYFALRAAEEINTNRQQSDIDAKIKEIEDNLRDDNTGGITHESWQRYLSTVRSYLSAAAAGELNEGIKNEIKEWLEEPQNIVESKALPITRASTFPGPGYKHRAKVVKASRYKHKEAPTGLLYRGQTKKEQKEQAAKLMQLVKKSERSRRDKELSNTEGSKQSRESVQKHNHKLPHPLYSQLSVFRNGGKTKKHKQKKGGKTRKQ